MFRLFVGTSFFLSALLFWMHRPVPQTPGVLAPSLPVQGPVTGTPTLAHDEFSIEPLATFEVQARVLSTERYYLGRESDLSPVDFALGWGPMSDSRILSFFSISQSRRWYWWRYKRLPIPRAEVIMNSANMHMVPASEEIARRLKHVRKGEIVRFTGYLIEASAPDGWRWRSSLSREDTGNHACELVWVETLDIVDAS